MASPFATVPAGVRLRMRVQPRARRSAVVGLVAEADGGAALKVAVTAAPKDGKANAAVITLLAAELGLAKSALAVVAGAADRRKTLLIAGEPQALLARLNDWLAKLPLRN